MIELYFCGKVELVWALPSSPELDYSQILDSLRALKKTVELTPVILR